MSNDYEAMYRQLQKETNDKLKRQDHVISKLEKKIDKMQAQNHAQMQTLDVRMQQMMGMFQMFMMNQTIGMNQMGNTAPQTLNPTALNAHSPKLTQSTSALPLASDNSNTPNPNTIADSLRIGSKPNASMAKSRSIGNLDHHSHRPRHVSHDSYDGDSEDGLFSKSRDHSRSRNKAKQRHKSSKKRKKQKHKKSHHKDSNRANKHANHANHSSDVPQFDENDMDINIPLQKRRGTDSRDSLSNRPVPPPPPKSQESKSTYSIENNKPIILKNSNSANNNDQNSPKPPPPTRSNTVTLDRDGHQRRSHRDKSDRTRRAHSKTRSHKRKKHRSKHQSSHSEDTKVVNFVAIDKNYGNHSPTEDSRVLLDNLPELELDVDTPSDEESLLYVHEDDLKEEGDPDIDESYDWTKKNAKNKKRRRESESEESDDDDMSMLSALKNPNMAIDDDDSGSSGYSDSGDSLHSSEDEIELSKNGMVLSEANLSKVEKKRRKKERKKARKREKKRKKRVRKREEKRLKKEKKEKERQIQRDKKNSYSNSTGLDKDTPNQGKTEMSASERSESLIKDDGDNNKSADKRRTTITGKIKKIGQKFKIGFIKDKDKDSDGDAKDVKSPNPLNIFKKSKEEIPSQSDFGNRNQRAKTTVTPQEMEKKNKKRFGLRGFTARIIKTKGNDDGVVDYGDRINAKQKLRVKRKPRRRGSDSNISNMSIDPWFDNKKKKKRKPNIRVDTDHSILKPDFDDADMTPPPSPLDKGYRFEHIIHQDSDSNNSENEIDLQLSHDMSGDGSARKKGGSIDQYRTSRGGSKSTQNNSIGAEDGKDPFGVEERKGDFDPDIDMGYDWTGYVAKTQLKQTHSDEGNKDKGKDGTTLALSPTKSDVRPHSARVGNSNGKKGKKQSKEQTFEFGNGKKSKPKRKNTKDKKENKSGHKRKTSKGLSGKKGKNNAGKKSKKPKAINVISEEKKHKGKKGGIRATNTPTINSKVNKGKKDINKKRGSARMFHENEKGKKRKKKDGNKSGKNKVTSPLPKIGSPIDESKEPEVLDRARGQSMNQTLAATDNYDEIEYTFANKKLKSLVPRMEYSKYENEVSKPGYKLQIEHVIGYNGYDNLCRNNLWTINNGSLVYNIGCLAVIHDLDNNKQSIYAQHKCPITSISVNHKQSYIASASLKSELSKNVSVIKIWDQDTLANICEIKCADIIGEVRHLRFSPISSLLYLTCGESKKNTQLCAFRVSENRKEINKAVLNMRFKTVNHKTVQIYGMIFNRAHSIEDKGYLDQFIVYGSNILYWCQVRKADRNRVQYCKINKLQPKGSTDGKKEKAYHCGLFLNPRNARNPGYYVLGGQSGTLYIGYKNTIVCALPAHQSRIQSINQYSPTQFITVGFDGVWKIWNIDFDASNGKFKEIYEFISENCKEKETETEEKQQSNSNSDEYEEKRVIPDYSTKIMKSGAVKVISEDCFVPSNDNISKHAHCSYYDRITKVLYIGTQCNSIVSIGNINTKSGDNELRILFGGHSQGIVGIAISPKLDSLIATQSEDGLLRLWNTQNKTKKNSKHNSSKNSNRLDHCVALQSLISGNKHSKGLKSTVIAWSPDGKFIATGYNISKVCLCTAHPLKKCQEIDLSQYRNKGKSLKTNQAITALCFSYAKSNVLAVGHHTQLSLFNVEKTNASSNKYKFNKWELTLTLSDVIRRLYFSENDDMLCVVTEKYETKFYQISMKKKTIIEAIRLPKSDIVWWPRIPLTSYILKGLYQKDSAYKWSKSELCDADICQSLKIVASADKYGIIRLHKLPALNQKSHTAIKYHCGQISKILFIPEQERLISVGLHDRSIIKWNIQKHKT